ncbi:MAG: TolC family protein [Cyanobacteria bacterium REEB67]|nr:TolC family protein [Cyanobacteria bacterium REEB67]
MIFARTPTAPLPVPAVWTDRLRTAFLAAIFLSSAAFSSSLPALGRAKGIIDCPAPAYKFSLSACFNQADAVNREIISARHNLPIARAAVTAAGAIPNPQFALQTGFGPTFYNLYTGQTKQALWTEQVQTAGKRRKKIDLARANYRLAEIQLDALRFDLHNRVRRAYAELAASEAYVDLIEAQRRVGSRLMVIAQKRFEAGKAAQSEYLQANLAVLQYDTSENIAKGRLEQASAALSQIIGIKPERVQVFDVDDNGLFKLSAANTDIVPTPDTAMPTLAAMIALAQKARPDLQAAQQQCFVARQALIVAKTRKIPDLFVSGGFVWTNFARHQPPGLVLTPPQSGAFVTVTAEQPILYQYRGEVRQAEANLRQAERQVDLLKSQINSDLITAYTQASVNRANIYKYQKEVLPTAVKVADLARRSYQIGSTDLATAIVAQQQYQQTLVNYFDCVVSYQTAWADLEKAVGVPIKL